jgi:hypothetical protein
MNKKIFVFLLLASISLTCILPPMQSEQNNQQTSPIQSENLDDATSEEPSEREVPALPTLSQPDQPSLMFCSDPLPPIITDLDVRQIPQIPEPAPHQPWRDPAFGSCLLRVTDRQKDIAPEDDSMGMKNEYSRVQSFNADGSLFLIRSLNAYWYVYDTSTLQNLGITPILTDPRWDANDPDLLYYSDGTLLMSYNVRSGEVAQVHDFANDFPGESLAEVWTRYEGSPSRDSRYWGLMAQNMSWETVAILVYDLTEDRVISIMETPHDMPLDSVTISPLGNYLLAYNDNYCEYGQLGSFEHPCGLMGYDRDLKNGRGLLRIIGHSDTALDANGREVLVYQDIDTDNISMLDLASGEVTPLLPIDFSHTAIGLHFSGRAFNQPGWVVISTLNGCQPQPCTWMDDTVFLLKLNSEGWVIRLAHTHSVYNEEMEHDYWAEPHASANLDLSRILFTSNWGRTGTEEVETYMIIMPQDWTDIAPW